MNSQEIVEKLTPYFEKTSKEFIETIISIFEVDTTEPRYLEKITKEPYFTYEEAVGFYHSGTCKDDDEEIPLGLEMTRALHFWGLWGAFRLSGPYEEGDEDISPEEALLFRCTGIRLCECVLDLFPECKRIVTDDYERIDDGTGWKYLAVVRAPQGGFEHIQLSDEEASRFW